MGAQAGEKPSLLDRVLATLWGKAIALVLYLGGNIALNMGEPP